MLCLHTIQKPDLSSFLAFDWLDLCQNVLSLHFEQQYKYKVYKVYIYRLWYLSSGCHNQIKHPISSTINLNHAFIPKSVDNNLPLDYNCQLQFFTLRWNLELVLVSHDELMMQMCEQYQQILDFSHQTRARRQRKILHCFSTFCNKSM